MPNHPETAPEPDAQPRRDELINVAEAARRLGRTEQQLRWQIMKGTAPTSAMVAGRRMFRAADVQRFIDDAFAAAAGNQ